MLIEKETLRDALICTIKSALIECEYDALYHRIDGAMQLYEDAIAQQAASDMERGEAVRRALGMEVE